MPLKLTFRIAACASVWWFGKAIVQSNSSTFLPHGLALAPRAGRFSAKDGHTKQTPDTELLARFNRYQNAAQRARAPSKSATPTHARLGSKPSRGPRFGARGRRLEPRRGRSLLSGKEELIWEGREHSDVALDRKCLNQGGSAMAGGGWLGWWWWWWWYSRRVSKFGEGHLHGLPRRSRTNISPTRVRNG